MTAKGRFTMKRAYKLQGELCGNCAAKIQDKISKMNGVNAASVNFMTMRFRLDADDGSYAELLEASKRVFSDVEPSCTVCA